MEKSKDSSVGALYMALPFTRGQAFIVSVLDAILSLVIGHVLLCMDVL